MFTKNEFKQIREDVKKALMEVEEKWNISLEPGNISYDDTGFKMQLIAERTDIDVAKVKFEENVRYFPKLTKDDYKAQFADGKRSLEIVGLKPGCKYSIVCHETNSDKEYCYTYDGIVRLLDRKEA